MHIEKYCREAVGHMLKHYSRNAKNYSNLDIDAERTEHNYNLCPHENAFAYYEQRLSEVKCQKRADVKTLCDWVITLPKQKFTDEQEHAFFREAYNFMEKRYGKENVVSAWVHKDEAGQPHLHFSFIPVTFDEKKGIFKVSAKEVITRKDLQKIHGEIESYLSLQLDMPVAMLNGATQEGNKTVEELKRYADMQKALKIDCEALESRLKSEKQALTELYTERERRKQYFLGASPKIPCTERKSILGRSFVEIEKEIWDKHKCDYRNLLGAYQETQDDMEQFKENYRAAIKANTEFYERNKTLTEENQALKNELFRYKKSLNELIHELIERWPQLEFFFEKFRTKKAPIREMPEIER